MQRIISRFPQDEPMRSIHRRMSVAAFERLPLRPGWKHEYYGGKAHITPSHITVSFLLDLTPRQTREGLHSNPAIMTGSESCLTDVNRPSIRPVTPADADALVQPFLEAFAQSPEYADYPAPIFKKTAVKYIAGFFGNVRGQWSPVSLVMEAKDRIVAAALVKRGRTLPLLDCLFVCPSHTRLGLATCLVHHVVNGLLQHGETQLLSYVLLANEPSLAWHHHFGFHEVPDLWVATSRWRTYANELDRRRALNNLPDAELVELTERAAFWRAEVDRLTELEKHDFWAAHPQFD